MPRKIALVGTASSGRDAPYADETYEIWGVSARGAYVTRADRWFELHCLDGEPPEWAASWRETMKGFTQDIPEVLMFWPEPDLAPKVRQYPKDVIANRFGTYFMTSTFSWMMALAIHEMRPEGCDTRPDGDEILIRGVDMEHGTEYRQQRAGFRHFIEIAKALGIAVNRDVAGGLIWEPTPYPFWQDDPLINKLERRNKEIKDGTRRLEDVHFSNDLMMAQNQALIQELEVEMLRPEYDKVQRLAQLRVELAAMEKTQRKHSNDLIAHSAVDQEQQWFLDYLRP